jgi:3-deoxy-D-manno-octulosonic-acid transferase
LTFSLTSRGWRKTRKQLSQGLLVLYHFVLIAASAIARLLAIFNKKIDRFFTLRRGELERIEDFFSRRNRERILWFHASSAGEFEGAKPVIEHLKSRYRDLLLIASFFSPSGYDAGVRYDGIDFCFNLPIDFRKNVRRLLCAINPSAIIFSRYDIWTNLSIEAHQMGITLILLSASLSEKSLRHRFPLRRFLRKSYNLFNRIYAISETDAERFMKIIDQEKMERIRVAGDTRFDRIKYVIEEGRKKPRDIIKTEAGNLYFLAGSTYSISEKILLQMMKGLNSRLNNLRYIIVPHEVDEGNIRRLTGLLRERGFTPIIYSNANTPITIGKDEILVIDAIGILAFLYEQSDIVFVGGSFRGSVHSVLEPAIFGKPILTGPAIKNSYEALKLCELGGLIMCGDAVDLYESTLKLIIDNGYRGTISKRVKDYFYNNIGATDLIVDDLKNIIA